MNRAQQKEQRDRERKAAYSVECALCQRLPGFVCVDENGVHVGFHDVRVADGLKAAGLPAPEPTSDVRHVRLTKEEIDAACFFLSLVLPDSKHPDAPTAQRAYETLLRRSKA